MLSIPQGVSAFGIGLTPSTIELDVDPGSHHRQILKVKNFNQNKAIKLTVSVADWILKEDGQVQLLPPEVGSRSASGWVNFSPSVLLLQPGASQQIIVDINAPLALKVNGDHRTAIILSTVLPPKESRSGKNGVWNRYQITSLFYANVLPGTSDPEITRASFRPNDVRAETILDLQIQNKGSRHSRLKGLIKLESSTNQVVSEQIFETVLMDNQTRNFAVKVADSSLKPGKYGIKIDLKDHGLSVPKSFKERAILVISE